MAPDVYARDVVQMLAQKSKPLWHWAGTMSSVVWAMYYFLPKSWRMYLVKKRTGLLQQL
jgi:hypothetical protein